MPASALHALRWLFDSRFGPRRVLIPRWIFLRALAAIYFSAFYSLLFQIKGLIGPQGVLPAGEYLAAVRRAMPSWHYWYAPSLFWFSADSQMLMVVTWFGVAAAVAAFFNVWPRLSFVVCFICFLSFVTASGEFSSYQSDGMLLEAGFLALFFVPGGLRPGWGAMRLPARASLFLLLWEWFRIYFESGIVKILGGDEEWRHLTAMDEYYQNGPLPTWIGWYVQHLPHWFHVATAAGTLIMEFGVVLMLFFPRRVRLICFLIVTPWEIGVILTANYTFLNYLVLSLGFLLLDDDALRRFLPLRFRPGVLEEQPKDPMKSEDAGLSILTEMDGARGEEKPAEDPEEDDKRSWRSRIGRHSRAVGFAFSFVMLTWIAYDTTEEMIGILVRDLPLPAGPVEALEPFRIANQYGLFAMMTRGRYEIEFQGSNDGQNWTAYPFRNKPQALNEAPRIYAPYQPRFDWNLWFASLGDWHEYNIVPLTEERLLENSGDVAGLFRANPFPQAPPRYVRAVLWQYWFTTAAEKKATGMWWRRQYMGLYAPELTRGSTRRFEVVEWPAELAPHD